MENTKTWSRQLCKSIKVKVSSNLIPYNIVLARLGLFTHNFTPILNLYIAAPYPGEYYTL